MSDLSEPQRWHTASDPVSLQLASAFQPVYSLSHLRLVGHEALLRVSDGSGRPVAPNELFAARGASAASTLQLDRDCIRLHLSSYAAQGKAEAAEWLFLNVHPSSLLGSDDEFARLALVIDASPVACSRLVIEVLESAHTDPGRLQARIEQLRALGCLIALDDFGAGHSNFERVFELSPHIVKLDRHVLLRAGASTKARRILQRMVSLLHECGALVLMEGVETLAGAHIALTCDVDLVQGYYYSRPARETLRAAVGNAGIVEAWRTFDADRPDDDEDWRDAMAEHCRQLQTAARQVAAGVPLAQACSRFLALAGASMCYLLDAAGAQVGDVVFAAGQSQQVLATASQFAPLHDCHGARWSRRPYFRRALAAADSVQLSRPYLTLQGSRMCFTASIAFRHAGAIRILCGDIAGADC